MRIFGILSSTTVVHLHHALRTCLRGLVLDISKRELPHVQTEIEYRHAVTVLNISILGYTLLSLPAPVSAPCVDVLPTCYVLVAAGGLRPIAVSFFPRGWPWSLLAFGMVFSSSL